MSLYSGPYAKYSRQLKENPYPEYYHCNGFLDIQNIEIAFNSYIHGNNILHNHCDCSLLMPCNKQFCFQNESICLFPNRVAWICTGDANLKDSKRREDFNKHFKSYKMMVGIMNIPHHGSEKSFNIDILPDKSIYSIVTKHNSVDYDVVKSEIEKFTRSKFIVVDNVQFKITTSHTLIKKSQD